ncbi:MAG: FAD-dependent oxidoreductase [Syntrophomonadaceae bacterium]|jgi:electron transfer flavoprotein-quinone oxidoreductase|nr:FAD-dependent oxidoreductase [Syntrophomonadaceae bacterium]
MEKFDVIIAGAGLAGLAAAYTLAQEGVEVLLIEKGDYPGAKNVTGGRLYVNPVRELFPDLWKKAPLERFITREGASIMAGERSINVEYCGSELSQEPYQSYSILRAKFDRWFAKQAERKGAMLVSKSRVDDVIIENDQVVGVWAGGDELRADVVIACDGVLSLLAEKAGLRKPGNPHDYAVGFKEVIELDSTLIEERFGLEGNEGAARLFMGEVTRGKFGGGFLYTNKDSLSLGIVVGIKDLMEGSPAVQAPILLDEFKQRPEIARLIKGGESVEYSAHVIPEGGLKAIGKLYGNGILLAGDAAGLAMNIGVTVRGMEYALASGYYAAQAVLQAKEKEDFTAGSLSGYEKLLNDSFIMKDFAAFKEAPAVLDSPRFFKHYPELLGNIMKDVYEVPAGPKGRLYPTIKKYLTLKEMWSMAGDMRKVMKI